MSVQVSRLFVGLILLCLGTVGLVVVLALVSMSDLRFVDRVEAVEMVAGVLVADVVLAGLWCLNWRAAFAATPGRSWAACAAVLGWWLAWDTACGVVFGGGVRTDLFDFVASATGEMAIGLLGFMAATSAIWRGRGCEGDAAASAGPLAAAHDRSGGLDADQPWLPGLGVTSFSKH